MVIEEKEGGIIGICLVIAEFPPDVKEEKKKSPSMTNPFCSLMTPRAKDNRRRQRVHFIVIAGHVSVLDRLIPEMIT